MFAHAYEHSRLERERERLLDAERAARSAAEHAVRVRDDFLSLAAHELRTPLTSLQLSVQALSRANVARRIPPEITRESGAFVVQRYLHTIERQLARLNLLVGDLLDASLIARGELPMIGSQVDLSDVGRAAVSQLEEPIRISGSRLTLDAPEAVIGNWDRARLERVVTNLVANAIKYGAGKPIEVIVRTQDSAAQLVVRDHGIGIPPGDQARVFGRFERAVPSEHYGGLGLGLYVVQSIVEQLGGHVTCESVPSEGSTFTVVLPRDCLDTRPEAEGCSRAPQRWGGQPHVVSRAAPGDYPRICFGTVKPRGGLAHPSCQPCISADEGPDQKLMCMMGATGGAGSGTAGAADAQAGDVRQASGRPARPMGACCCVTSVGDNDASHVIPVMSATPPTIAGAHT